MDAVKELKKLIDKNGRDYLDDEPYLVYKQLIAAEKADKTLAGAILMVLVGGCLKTIDDIKEPEAFSELIQRECCFHKKMADKLTEIFLTLYSDEYIDEWKRKELAEWRQFQKRELRYHWKGSSVWTESNGCVSCYYNADITLKPAANIKAEQELEKALKKTPFLPDGEIRKHYEKALKGYLDYEFEDYITCDDYYEPVVEDFEIEYYVKEWCKTNGFEMIACEGDGYDDGYEPF